MAQLDIFGNPIEEFNDLKKEFGANPFTVLDTKDGLWLAKKRRWISIGLKSEVGRDAATYNMKEWANQKREEGKLQGHKLPSDTSIFDPVLCEIIYRWFCKNGGKILDPFAGGSVRGIVAHYLGYKYTGIDIRQEQVDSNYEQAHNILDEDNIPNWIVGDSNLVVNDIDDEFDLIFTCPPYVNMETYSDLDGDISNMKYDDFIFSLESILRNSCKKLKRGGNLVIVVGEVRNREGNYYGFVADTVKMIQRIRRMEFYNDFILETSLASAPLRAVGNMKSGKLVKIHQNILMFRKM